jgi:hypothetical protein
VAVQAIMRMAFLKVNCARKQPFPPGQRQAEVRRNKA